MHVVNYPLYHIVHSIGSSWQTVKNTKSTLFLFLSLLFFPASLPVSLSLSLTRLQIFQRKSKTDTNIFHVYQIMVLEKLPNVTMIRKSHIYHTINARKKKNLQTREKKPPIDTIFIFDAFIRRFATIYMKVNQIVDCNLIFVLD